MPTEIRRLALLVALGSIGACYSYAPVDGPVPVGSEVKARLTQETALAESELLGSLTQDYSGRVLSMTDDSVAISVVSARAIGTATTQAFRRPVTLPRTGIQQLSVRSLSWPKTAVAMGASVAVMAAVIGTLEFGGGQGGDPPGDPAFRPGFRFSFPF